jgi:hypothetical protein
MRADPDQHGHPDEHQRGGRRSLGVLTRDLHELRHGADRATPAERTERQPDEEPGGEASRARTRQPAAGTVTG